MNLLSSNRVRFYALVVAAVLFFPITWKLAIKKTVEAHRQITEIEDKLVMVESNTPEQIALVEKRLEFLDHLLVKDGPGDAFQNRVLHEISSICTQKGLLLKEMPPMFHAVDNNYLVETINIQVAGSFHHLLQLLYEIEKPQKKLNLISSHFFTKENKQSKQKQLILSIYIQTLQEKQ
ncbi:MAG: type 4a pilus biogenesis protein PilO [Salinivirgaceae bacterium]|jgi:Tfp pilus assembly protein PilO